MSAHGMMPLEKGSELEGGSQSEAQNDSGRSGRFAVMTVVALVFALAALFGGGHLFSKGPSMLVAGNSVDQITLAAITVKRGKFWSKGKGTCLTVEDNSHNVVQNHCDKKNDNNQIWELKADGQLKIAASNKCLDVHGAGGKKAGTNVQIYECHERDNQRFIWQEDGKFVLKGTQMCLDIYKPGGPPWGSLKKNVQIHHCGAKWSHQKWGIWEEK